MPWPWVALVGVLIAGAVTVLALLALSLWRRSRRLVRELALVAEEVGTSRHPPGA